MNKNTTRGLALVVITGGLSFLGVTAANAVDLPDLGGTSGGSILDSFRIDQPVTVDGQNVSVLDPNDASSLLGNGVGASTGDTMADIFAQLGIDTSGVVDNNSLTSAVGVPVDVSNSWVSVLGNKPNGVVVVPNASIPAWAWLTANIDSFFHGVADGFVNAPVDISCTSVAVISDFKNDCGQSTDVGKGLGVNGILDGATHNEFPVTVSDATVNVLDGNTVDLGTLGGDGVVVDPTSDGTDVHAMVGFLDGQLVTVAAPVDASDAWVSVLGKNGGVVIVPDSAVNGSLRSAGLVDSNTAAPVSIQCVTITVLSDFNRDCAGNANTVVDLGTLSMSDLGAMGLSDLGAMGLGDLGTLSLGDLGAFSLGGPGASEPGATGSGGLGDLGTHALPVPNDGTAGNGGTGDTNTGGPCLTGATLMASDANTGLNAGLIGGAVLAGALAAFGLMALRRTFLVA